LLSIQRGISLTYEIRARSLGEILDGAFQLYRNNFWTFLGTAAAISISSQIIVMLATWGLTGTLSGAPSQQSDMGNLWLVFLITLPIIWGAYVLENATLTIAIADAYLGRPVSIASALRRTTRILGPLIGAAVLTGLGIGLGMVLLVIPGIIFSLNWLFTVQAIAIEGCGASESLGRSKTLTYGRRGRLALLVFLLTLITMAINFGAAAIIPASVSALPLIGSLLQQFPAVLLAPLYPGVMTLAYFDARVRGEAFDLEILARGIGGEAPAPSPTVAPAV
jgi:hypothetical protein